MDQAAPAHQALHLSVTSRQGSGQFGTWRRQPGRPRKYWVEQVTTSTGLSLSDAWKMSKGNFSESKCHLSRFPYSLQTLKGITAGSTPSRLRVTDKM